MLLNSEDDLLQISSILEANSKSVTLYIKTESNILNRKESGNPMHFKFYIMDRLK